MQKTLESEYFRLLLKNSVNELEDFISRNGKIKATCPIRFIDKDNEEDNKNDKDN